MCGCVVVCVWGGGGGWVGVREREWVCVGVWVCVRAHVCVCVGVFKPILGDT